MEETLKLSNHNIIHLITHGQFSSDLEETFILTDDDSKNPNNRNDYSININEFSNLLKSQEQNIPIELLVLSACETADGDNRAVLGIAGIAVKSGADATIAPVWKVDQKDTTKLMTEFYKNLVNPEVEVRNKAEALHLAQQSMDKNGKEPYEWAAFILVGY